MNTAREDHTTRRRILDISAPLTADFPVWPGDTEFTLEPVSRIADGASVDLTRLQTTLHLGTHADAPRHTEADGGGIDSMSLACYLGPAKVLDVTHRVDGRGLIPASVLDGVDVRSTPRILLRTGTSFRPDSRPDARPEADDCAPRFPTEFPALSPALARALGDQGAVLLGTDAPSVDPFTSKSLDAHHLLLGRGVAILEGLQLKAAPTDVEVELIALPLRLIGADASPVRAALRYTEAD